MSVFARFCGGERSRISDVPFTFTDALTLSVAGVFAHF
jgi:hypothetical protein